MDVEKLNESSRPTENMTRPDGDKKRGKETRGKSWDENALRKKREEKKSKGGAGGGQMKTNSKSIAAPFDVKESPPAATAASSHLLTSLKMLT